MVLLLHFVFNSVTNVYFPSRLLNLLRAILPGRTGKRIPKGSLEESQANPQLPLPSPALRDKIWPAAQASGGEPQEDT